MQTEEIHEFFSLMRRWCIGIVVADKPFGTDTIMVSPIERLTMQGGNIADNQESYNQAVPTTEGIANTQNLNSVAKLQANWIPGGDNHLFTSPMVRQGETVQLYKYSDSDEIFWNTIYREPGLRRTERIIWAAGNLSGSGGSLDLNSVYMIELDTINKAINLKTTTSDGEAYAYQLSLDPKNKVAYITDSVGNRVAIDSENNNVILEDVHGGKVETRDGHPKITGTKGILLTSPSNVIEGPTKFTSAVDIGSTLSVASGITMGGGGGAEAVFNGNIVVNGGATFAGYVSLDGGHGPPD